MEVAARAHGEVARALSEERRRRELAARVACLPERRAALAAASEQLARARALHEEKKADVVGASTSLQRARAAAEVANGASRSWPPSRRGAERAS
jgi:chromosome segregation ATPase